MIDMFTKVFFHITWMSLFMADGAFVGWMIFGSAILITFTGIALALCITCYHFLVYAKRNNL